MAKEEDGLLPTLTPRSFIWLLKLRNQVMARPLLGLEMCYIQGFPKFWMNRALLAKCDVSENLLRDLAGNSFASGPLMATLIGVLLSVCVPRVRCVRALRSVRSAFAIAAFGACVRALRSAAFRRLFVRSGGGLRSGLAFGCVQAAFCAFGRCVRAAFGAARSVPRVRPAFGSRR